MAYTYDPIFAADPSNAANVAVNASIIIFDPADPGKAPITITDVTGSPLPNPITVNKQGFGPAFQHATLDRVGWFGAGFTGYFTSYEGMKAEAVAAREAAQSAAVTAGVGATAEIAARIAAGEFKGAPGTNGTDGVNGANVLPTQQAIETALTSDGPAKTALTAAFGSVLRLESQPGVDPNGVTECAAAIQTAADLAKAKGIPLVGSGFYKIATGVTITDHADLAACVFTYTGTTGTAITVGNAAGIIRKNIALPYVAASAKTTTGWAQVAGSVGVKLLNVSNSSIKVPSVTKFETGLLLYGQDHGTTYNRVELGELTTNKVNLQHDNNATGYVNQNTFIGGRFGYDGSEGTLVSGTRHILHSNSGSFVADGNTYIGTSLEDPGVVEYIIESYGWYNTWASCRWENFGAPGTKKVWFRGTAKGNVISDGYEAEKLTMIQDAGTANNQILSPFVDQSIWLPVNELKPTSGSAAIAATLGGMDYWEMNATASSEVAASVLIPTHWQKASVTLHWFSQSGGAGNVALNIKYKAQGAGATVGFPGFVGAGGPWVSGAASTTAQTVVRADLPVTPGPVYISALRDGAAAGDTMTGNIGLTGIMITRIA